MYIDTVMIINPIKSQAGISKQRLQLALESEAAAIYTKEVLLQRSISTKEDEEGHTIRCQEGTKFIVTDLGGVKIFVFIILFIRCLLLSQYFRMHCKMVFNFTVRHDHAF